MKIFAALTIAAVNGESRWRIGGEAVKCWNGEGKSIEEFTANAVRVECAENELCQMTVR